MESRSNQAASELLWQKQFNKDQNTGKGSAQARCMFLLVRLGPLPGVHHAVALEIPVHRGSCVQPLPTRNGPSGMEPRVRICPLIYVLILTLLELEITLQDYDLTLVNTFDLKLTSCYLRQSILRVKDKKRVM